MKAAAIGLRVHSGWGALIVLAGPRSAEEFVARHRVEIINAKTAGSKQPYHYVAAMEVDAARRHLARCEKECRHLALESLSQILAEVRGRGFALTGSAILLSSARPLPDLNQILASHALIHTAEGEFFRQAFRHAFEALEIPVIGIRERELDDCAQKAFGKDAGTLQQTIDCMGRSLGPPWTQDQKFAALAAAIALAGSHPKVRVANNTGA